MGRGRVMSMKDHLIHNDSITHCYCGCELKEWKSEFNSCIHYKTASCTQCNRKNKIRLTTEGSGFDRWHEKRGKKQTFEMLVQQEHMKAHPQSTTVPANFELSSTFFIL